MLSDLDFVKLRSEVKGMSITGLKLPVNLFPYSEQSVVDALMGMAIPMSSISPSIRGRECSSHFFNVGPYNLHSCMHLVKKILNMHPPVVIGRQSGKSLERAVAGWLAR
jgi:hypothetical protein